MGKRLARLCNPSHAVAYLRTSRGEDQQRFSPDAQRLDIERWAERTGVRIVAWFEERVESTRGLTSEGALDLTERPELARALEAVTAHRAGKLVAARRDRFARDVLLMKLLDRVVPLRGAKLVSAAGEGTDSDDSDSEDYRTFADMTSSREKRRIIARTRSALAAKKRHGELTGSAPYGYRVGADGVHLEPDPGEQAVIARIRSLRASGLTHMSIVGVLTADGVVGRFGVLKDDKGVFVSRVPGKPFSQTQVARVLARP